MTASEKLLADQPFKTNDIAAGRRRFPFLGFAWLCYMVFTIVAYPICGISVMLPSILLCALATWIYGYKIALLTCFLTQPFNMLMMMYNLDSLDGWRPALEIGGILSQLIAVGCIGIMKDNKMKIEVLTQELELSVQERTRELTEVSDLVEAQAESEQTLLSDTLYNDVAKHLSTLLQHCEALEESLSQNLLPQAQAAAKLTHIAERNIALVKNLAGNLSSEHLSEAGIERSIQELAAFYHETTDAQFVVSITPRHREIPSKVTVNLYRITHEVVNNAMRHAKADRIIIKLDLDNTTCLLEVINNGSPLPSRLVEGTGISLIHQRSHKINGRSDFCTTDDGNTHFSCHVNRSEGSS